MSLRSHPSCFPTTDSQEMWQRQLWQQQAQKQVQKPAPPNLVPLPPVPERPKPSGHPLDVQFVCNFIAQGDLAYVQDEGVNSFRSPTYLVDFDKLAQEFSFFQHDLFPAIDQYEEDGSLSDDEKNALNALLEDYVNSVDDLKDPGQRNQMISGGAHLNWQLVDSAYAYVGVFHRVAVSAWTAKVKSTALDASYNAGFENLPGLAQMHAHPLDTILAIQDMSFNAGIQLTSTQSVNQFMKLPQLDVHILPRVSVGGAYYTGQVDETRQSLSAAYVSTLHDVSESSLSFEQTLSTASNVLHEQYQRNDLWLYAAFNHQDRLDLQLNVVDTRISGTAQNTDNSMMLEQGTDPYRFDDSNTSADQSVPLDAHLAQPFGTVFLEPLEPGGLRLTEFASLHLNSDGSVEAPYALLGGQLSSPSVVVGPLEPFVYAEGLAATTEDYLLGNDHFWDGRAGLYLTTDAAKTQQQLNRHFRSAASIQTMPLHPDERLVEYLHDDMTHFVDGFGMAYLPAIGAVQADYASPTSFIRLLIDPGSENFSAGLNFGLRDALHASQHHLPGLDLVSGTLLEWGHHEDSSVLEHAVITLGASVVYP